MITDWKQAAINYAAIYGVDSRIVLATIEAETSGRNVLGDSGRAFGYGQVWLKWHYSKLVRAAADMGLKIPAQPKNEAEEQQFKPLILGNDELSMRLAVITIKSFWDGAGHDWLKFTKGYVGAGISQSSIDRRRKIWDKYASTDSDDAFNIPSDVKNLSNDDLVKYATIGIAAAALVFKAIK